MLWWCKKLVGIVDIKSLIIIFLQLAGVAMLAIGLLLFFASHVESSSLDVLENVATEETILPNNREFKGLSIVLICLGTLVSFVSFLGCFGACINGKCLLVTVSWTMVFPFVVRSLVKL